jgi:hypothetical protein
MRRARVYPSVILAVTLLAYGKCRFCGRPATAGSFSDLNNLEIADLMYKFLEKKGLN